MILVVVFYSSNKLQSMLVDYTVIEMGCFDDYLDDESQSKTMRGNDITSFLLHVDQYIIVNKSKFVLATLISEAGLKSLYSRLGFKVIKYLMTSTNFEEACERFRYESGKKNGETNNWLKMLSNHPTTCYNSSIQSN